MRRNMTLREWLRWRWAQVAYNWFTLGLWCSVKGHEWREDGVGCLHCKHTVCANCGKYRGCRRRGGVPPHYRHGGDVR
jgi:hypothetical protein